MYRIEMIFYKGVKTFLPEFLIKEWPFDFPHDQWPTFCGAGSGFGDKIVPDSIYGVSVSPACFLHDIGWAICDNSYADFKVVNSQFRKNLINITDMYLTGWKKYAARSRCYGYYWTVSTIGWRYFKSDDVDTIKVDDPATHPVVIERLDSLNTTIAEYNNLK